MTDGLERAVNTVRRLPAQAQDQIAQAMLELAGIGSAVLIDPAHQDDVIAGLDEIARGEIASDEDVETAFRQFGR